MTIRFLLDVTFAKSRDKKSIFMVALGEKQ